MRNDSELGWAPGARPSGAEDPSRLATFEQYRGRLFSIAYRMLGSVADAEDILQEAFIRWQAAKDEIHGVAGAADSDRTCGVSSA